jgi:putative DNA primase/helicase
MADLTSVFGGPWSPPPEPRVDPVEVQLADAMRAAGLDPPDSIIIDGKLHRWHTGHGRRTDKTGWYSVYPDGVPAGAFGCWRLGIDAKFVAVIGRKQTPAEEMAHAARIAAARKEREEVKARLHEAVSDTVTEIWSKGQDASPKHPYLLRKGVQPHGAKVTGDGRLMLPLLNSDGTISSLQYIDADGGKLYHSGGQVGGKFWMLGTLDQPGKLYVAEGFATAATIHEVTGRPCVVAYSASNLPATMAELRAALGGHQEIVIVADNDRSGTGQMYADQAAAKHGARVVMPPEIGDANDWYTSGHDLLLLLEPPMEEWLIHADDFSAQPAPISWLVKNWLQEKALIMVHGPSGGGKTFVVLDMCLRIASGMDNWCGQRVKHGAVVYLAGEGHHGLRGRIAAWKHYHKAGRLDMWLSRDGCDLNTTGGYAKVVEHIRALPTPPKVIIVDTLHRFLAGDENSAQDAKTMLDACAMLMREFGCSVVLVHHTGVSEEAQHRARGSSAWRGALDIEISVVPGKNGPLQIVQRKSKDAELAATIHADLQQVAIPGWMDEDGQQVTSAVIVQSDAPPDVRKDSKLEGHRKTFVNAWVDSSMDIEDDAPYLTKSFLVAHLVDKMGYTNATAEQYTKPSSGKMINELLNAQIIAPHKSGWRVVNDALASAMMVKKNG